MSVETKVNEQCAWTDRVKALQNVPVVLRILWQSGPLVVTCGLVFRSILAMGPVAAAYVAKSIINGVQQAISGHGIPPLFWRYVLAEMLIVLSTSLLIRIIDYFDSLLADRYTHYVSIRVLEHAAELDLATYEDPVFYDRLDRARIQSTDRLSMIQAMGRLLQFSLQMFFFSAAVFWKGPILFLFLMVSAVPSFLGDTHFAFLGYAKNYRQTPQKREMNYIRLIGGSKQAAKELRLFNLSRFLSDRFRRLSQLIYAENAAFSRRRLRWGAVSAVLSVGGYYSSYIYIIWRAIHGGYDIGTFAFIIRAIQQAQNNLQLVFSTVSGIADQALFLTDLVAFFEMKPGLVSRPNGRQVPHPIHQGFEFREVSFSYPGSDRLVLEKFSFSLRPGERIALIGENGEGKTTVVKLITRLYDPTEGQILLDGVDLREYELEGLHREIGVIFQEFMRYEMTLRDNIAVGRTEQSHSNADIALAAEKSLAAGVVSKLPDGYDQMLGRYFANGTDLSGGEWQKVALARAYLRDAQLLVLDEPTAALDAKSEMEVFQRFAELTEGKMAFLISHRFSTVRMADRIVVLSGGRIVEEGDHAGLMSLGGRYAQMFEMQAASYR
jgi:ATP-binding cassette, subfamily B, bacterial